MKELFLGLCSASIIPSIAVLAAILLRPLLKKGPSFLRCVIWAVVFARLVIPVGLIELSVPVSPFPSPAEETVSQFVSDAVQNDVPNVVPGTVSTPYTDVPNVIPGTVSTPYTDVPNVIPDTAVPEPAPTPEEAVPQPVPQTVSPEEPTVDVVEILSLVWVCGIIVMLGYLTASSLLLHYQVLDAVVYDSRVRVLGQNCSPFVSGFFRPLIYIPASANRADWPYYIAHEESHIKRFDHILKPLAFLVLCIHWFNPLVWAAYLLLSKDIEYACDEKTVKNMAEADRKAYSLALLSVSQGGSPVFSPLSFGKVSVKERITRIMKGKIPVWAICLTVVLCAALLTLMVCTAAGTSDETSSEVSDETSGETSEETSSEVSNETSGETSSEVSNETSGETSGGTTVAGIEADYKNASSLHVQDPETYRDPGELQSETREMVRLEDGQWYQSYVASDVNIRYVFLSNAEYEMNANWDFIPIGSEKTYYLYNAGARFEDETGVARYVERPIAVWGELDGGDGEKYSRVLVLTDELTVCVEGEGGTCAFYQTDRIALPRWLGPLFWDKDEFDSEMVTGVVMLDEDGIFYLKDVALFLPAPLKAAYVNALSLHAQDPETYRDPGDLQYETQEMVQLENGQWYQSFVSTSANVRYVFLSNVEYEISAKWDFFPIGSAKNYFLLNFGTQYEDASGLAPYVERQIAVRGTLADGSNGYAYTLRLPDELTVCVAGENGVCDFCEAETLAVSLPDGMTGEKVLTGVVAQDENGVLYLKDASVYASVGPGSPSEGQAVTMGAFVREPEFLRLQQTVYRFLSACIRTDQKGALAFARNVDALPAQFPLSSSPDRLTAYAYTSIRFEPYTLDGTDTQKVDLTVRYALQNANQGVSASLSVVRTNPGDADWNANWKVLSCELTPVPAESATDLTFAGGSYGMPLTLETFCGTERYVSLQNTAFRFFNAYLKGDRETALTVADEDALMGAFNERVSSLDEQGLTLSGFGSDGSPSAYAEYDFTRTDEWGGRQVFYFLMRFTCTTSETDAGRKTWRVIGFDFEG